MFLVCERAGPRKEAQEVGVHIPLFLIHVHLPSLPVHVPQDLPEVSVSHNVVADVADASRCLSQMDIVGALGHDRGEDLTQDAVRERGGPIGAAEGAHFLVT